MQQERKEAGEGEPGRALTIEQREEQGKINIQLVPCLTRETEAAVVLLPCSFQAHLTGSREGTPALSDVIIFYFLIISPPSSPVFPPLSFAQMISATRPGKSGTFSHSSHRLPPPSPASPPSTDSNPGKTTAPTHPKVFVLPKTKEKKRRKEKKSALG